MLLTCSSCNSRYLVNSADLKPNGRTVRCATCGNEWLQKPNLIEEETLEPSVPRTVKEENNKLKQEKPLLINQKITTATNKNSTTIMELIIFGFSFLI